MAYERGNGAGGGKKKKSISGRTRGAKPKPKIKAKPRKKRVRTKRSTKKTGTAASIAARRRAAAKRRATAKKRKVTATRPKKGTGKKGGVATMPKRDVEGGKKSLAAAAEKKNPQATPYLPMIQQGPNPLEAPRAENIHPLAPGPGYPTVTQPRYEPFGSQPPLGAGPPSPGGTPYNPIVGAVKGLYDFGKSLKPGAGGPSAPPQHQQYTPLQMGGGTPSQPQTMGDRTRTGVPTQGVRNEGPTPGARVNTISSDLSRQKTAAGNVTTQTGQYTKKRSPITSGRSRVGGRRAPGRSGGSRAPSRPAPAPAPAPAPQPQGDYAMDHVLVRYGDGMWNAGLGGENVFGNWYKMPLLPGETPEEALLRYQGMDGVELAELNRMLGLDPTNPQPGPAPVSPSGAPPAGTPTPWPYNPGPQPDPGTQALGRYELDPNTYANLSPQIRAVYDAWVAGGMNPNQMWTGGTPPWIFDESGGGLARYSPLPQGIPALASAQPAYPQTSWDPNQPLTTRWPWPSQNYYAPGLSF